MKQEENEHWFSWGNGKYLLDSVIVSLVWPFKAELTTHVSNPCPNLQEAVFILMILSGHSSLDTITLYSY